MNNFKEDFAEAKRVLDDFISNDQIYEKLEKAGKLIIDALHNNKKIVSCGNGGSMCDAMHFAEELTGRFRNDRPAIAAVSISDPSYITCVSNDYGFDYIFSRYLEALGNEGDILLAISTSGNSTNILKAAEAAIVKKIKIISLTGKDGGKLGQMSDVEIRVPHFRYSDRIQEIHIKVIHSLINYIELNI